LQTRYTKKTRPNPGDKVVFDGEYKILHGAIGHVISNTENLVGVRFDNIGVHLCNPEYLLAFMSLEDMNNKLLRRKSNV
jgi:hypothetical protein